MTRIFLFLIGFGLIVINFSSIILYLNLFTIGYNCLDYVNFIIRHSQIYLIVIGIIFLSISMRRRDE